MRHQGASGSWHAKAKANGVCKGRPVSLNHNQIRALHSQELGATEIAKQLRCSRDR
jgi:hypothetical protein